MKALHKLKTISELLRKSTVSYVLWRGKGLVNVLHTYVRTYVCRPSPPVSPADAQLSVVAAVHAGGKRVYTHVVHAIMCCQGLQSVQMVVL